MPPCQCIFKTTCRKGPVMLPIVGINYYARTNKQWHEELLQCCVKYRDKDEVMESVIKDQAGICARHFIANCFKFTKCGTMKIKPGSIPTLFLPELLLPSPIMPLPVPQVHNELPENNEPEENSNSSLQTDLQSLVNNFMKLNRKDWLISQTVGYFALINEQQHIKLELNQDLSVNKFSINNSKTKWEGPHDLRRETIRSVLNSAEEFANQFKVANKENQAPVFLKSKERQPLKLKAPISTASRGRLEATITHMKKQNKILLQELGAIRSKLIDGSSVVVNEEQSKDIVNGMKTLLGDNKLTPYQKMFWQEQMKLQNCEVGGERYHPEIIRLSLSVYTKSPAAYDEIRGVLKLPSKSTLLDYRYAEKPEIGITENLRQRLKLQCGNLPEHEKYVMLALDEMQIRKGLVFDPATGNLVGFTNYGDSFHQENNLATHMLGFYVKGLSGSLSQILAYFPTDTAKAHHLSALFWDAFELLEDIGLKLMLVCADGSSNNRKFFSNLVTNFDEDFKFRNPFDKSRYVYLWPDPPHLIKTARNSLLKNTVVSPDGPILWSHIESIFSKVSNNHLHQPCKLTKQHVHLTNFSKMSVRLATQVLSASVATIAKQQGYVATAHYAELWNKFFDICNCSIGTTAKKNPDMMAISDVGDLRLQWLNDTFLKFFDDWYEMAKSKENKHMFIAEPTYKGIKILVPSMIELASYMLTNVRGLKYLCFGRMNQDCLERHFGQQRSIGRRNENPDVLNFGYNVRILEVQRSIKCIRGNVHCKKQLLPTYPQTEPLKKRPRIY